MKKISICVASSLLLILISAQADSASVDVPLTGQTNCFQVDGTEEACPGAGPAGQDGDELAGAVWPDPRFAANADTSITDLLTGLIWAPDGNTPDVVGCAHGNSTWQEALDYVACLNAGSYLGHDDWRVPNLREMQSLVHHGYSAQSCGGPDCASPSDWLNNQGFSNMQAGNYWGSNTSTSSATSAYMIHMLNGSWTSGLKTGYLVDVLPVRGEALKRSGLGKTGATTSYDDNDPQADDGALEMGIAWPSPRFTDHLDGTVTDNLTGLMWLKDMNCIETRDAALDPDFDNDDTVGDGKVTWAHAFDFIAGMNAGTYAECNGGHTDWRLPNRLELGSLVDMENASPALPTGHPFTNIASPYFWSSTTYLGTMSEVLTVNFSAGGQGHTHAKTEFWFVWPVRGGLVGGTPDIGVATTDVDAGEVTVDDTSDTEVTVTNEGTNYLYIGDVDGLTAPFSIVSDTCSNTGVAPSDTCVVTARFSPTAEGDFDDSFDIPSSDPDENPLTVNLSGTGTVEAVDTPGTTNTPPAACTLVYPADGASGLGTSVTFIWKMSSDADGDDISYDLTVCENEDFSGCDAIEGVALKMTPSLAGEVLLFARKWVIPIIAAPFSLAGCGGSTSAPTDTTPTVGADELSYEMSGLSPSTTYYWKIAASDAGGTTESGVFSFTTE